MQSLLTASALAAALTLAACGDSPTGQANKNAAEASNKAARLSASAGDYRPTALVQQELASGKSVTALSAEVTSKIKADPSAYTKYIEAKSVAADLGTSDKLLNEALGQQQLDDQAKSLLRTQLAQNAHQLAVLELASVSDHLRQLFHEATQVQLASERVTTAANYAKLAAGRQGTPPELAKLIEEAKQEATRLEGVKMQKADAAKTLADRFAAKQAEARRIADQARRDQAAAERATGLGSIEDFNKAVALKAQAGKIAMEAAVLQPAVQEAQSEAEVAQIQATAAQEHVTYLAKHQEIVTARAQTATGQATALRQQTKELVENPTSGLRFHEQAFRDSAVKLDKAIQSALKNANTAAGAYGQAVSNLNTFSGNYKVPEGHPTAESVDKVLKDRQIAALLQLSQASANARAAEAYTAAFLAAKLQDLVASSAGHAYSLAEIGTKPAPGASADAKTKAEESLKKADELITRAIDSIKSPDTSPVKWLGYSLRSSVAQGRYVLSEKPADRTAAKDAADEALRRNPGLAFPGLISSK